MLPDTILVVEDDIDDWFFIRRAIERAGLKNPVDVVRDGEAAIQLFAQIADNVKEGRACTLPLFVLLDLKLPKFNGFELLEWIRNRPELAKLVIIVLTSSGLGADVLMAYQLGARSYLVKPPLAVDVLAIFNTINELATPGWLTPRAFPGLPNPARS